MRVSVITPPQPVVSWEQANAHLRLDGDVSAKVYVEGLIAVATAWIDGPDGWLGRALGEQVLEVVLPAGVWSRERRLPLPPLLGIVSETPSADGVTVRYRAGYVDSAVPAPIRHAILLMVGHLYENRMAVTAATSMGAMPMGVDALLSPYRVWGI
ncbi:head-tail connector protein [Methylobacterium sp. Leaf100]|uniref:head-tail connector protein n=1 Tax=Methylobacterium sp. Leaf100 TaxID=1736252 RepID=UPI0006F94D30|nr:head-tail connector protein [Methylobacterium sp. Leaf100]KQP36691.1 hypothetical protein ASF25_01680 [Methylobacterium sp. Leaf100]